jgi:hypothetical protein
VPLSRFCLSGFDLAWPPIVLPIDYQRQWYASVTKSVRQIRIQYVANSIFQLRDDANIATAGTAEKRVNFSDFVNGVLVRSCWLLP